MDDKQNIYYSRQPPFPWKSYVGAILVAGGLATPIAQLALRQIGLATYAWRQAATLAGAAGLLTTVYIFDTHDWLIFNMVAYQAHQANPPKLGQYIQYWKQAAELRLDDLSEEGTRFDQRRWRAALVRACYFTHVGKNPLYMITLEEVFRTTTVSTYINEGRPPPFLPATE